MNKKILNILPLLGHPRHAKRISVLQQLNFDVEVITFNREYHSGRIPDCNITNLELSFKNRRYFDRIFKILIAIPKTRS